ncbi:MAG: type II secretion system F family protein [Lachnospiraceae bacterium]|nr:type II secretion system F family protein [Lachnospiraceae bacterium]
MTISLKQRVLRHREEKLFFFRQKQRGIPLYSCYFFSKKEAFLYAIMSLGIVLFFSFFFYRSLIAAAFIWPIGVLAYLSFQKEKGNKRKQKLEIEFKDCILSVAANLRAGYSVENAFEESIQDIQSLYGESSLMRSELFRMKKGIAHNVPLEELLSELGARSGIANIQEFGEVFAIARSSGGRLPEIIQSTADLIGEKIALQQEIQVVLSGKKFEQKIMDVVPFLLVGYIGISTPGFFDVLYHNLMGICIMSVCMLLYLAAFFLAEYICKNII